MTKNSSFMAVFFVYFLWIGSSADPAAAAEGSVPSLFVFGDSLVDAGNNNYLPVSVAKANYPHNGVDFPTKKPTGRFCNGKNAADLLAEKLGLPWPPPYLSLKHKENDSAILTGVSFASGGAGIFNSSDQALGQAIPLSRQINDYLSVHEELMNQLQPSDAQNHLSKSIFMIVIGSNDLFDYFGSFNLRRKNDPQQYTALMASKLKEQLKRLYDYGARKLVVIGVGPIGCTPAQRAKNTTRGCNEEANMWCSTYNDALKTMLQQLGQELHGSLSYSYFDNYKAVRDVIVNPEAYGFMDVISACCGSGKLNADLPCNPTSKYCQDRTRHFFWDRFGHPTEATAQFSVDYMFNGSSGYSFPLNIERLVSL